MKQFEPTPEQLIESANMWTERREKAIAAADFCEQQAQRFLGKIVVPDEYKPTLTLVWSDRWQEKPPSQ